tara:strand:+ start:1190 stop:1900 length:711 start_codon:yes stop_codon:yes gene_type:complete
MSNKRAKAWMPLYVSDFLVGTLGWDAASVGHYIRLLLVQWDRGSLPADTSAWESLTLGVGEHLIQLEEKFPICPDGLRRNVRLEEERVKAQEVYMKRVNAGVKGAEKRWGGEPDVGADESSSAATSLPNPRMAATRGATEARVAFDLAPTIKKQGWKPFLRSWNEIVVRQLLDIDKVTNGFRDYYASPKGVGKYARGPQRLLEEEVWEDDPASWETQQTEDATESMSMLDEIMGGE